MFREPDEQVNELVSPAEPRAKWAVPTMLDPVTRQEVVPAARECRMHFRWRKPDSVQKDRIAEDRLSDNTTSHPKPLNAICDWSDGMISAPREFRAGGLAVLAIMLAACASSSGHRASRSVPSSSPASSSASSASSA